MTPTTARRTTLVTAMLMVVGACSASPEQDGRAAESSPSPSTGTQEPTTASAPPTAAGATGKVELGNFPEFPQGRLADAVAVEMQALLDAAVEEGAVLGISAAVIAAGSGSWSGAAGVNRRDRLPMSPASVLPTASVGKTVIAAQVLRLVDEEQLGLDDRAADHLPPELPERLSSRVGDVTIRELLGMRSGLTDGGVTADPGPTPVYANVNYDILAAIIDHVTGNRLPQVVRAGVLGDPGLDGLVFEADSERWPHDGHMRADAVTMARWGYELYGGVVLSDARLRDMLDFGGEWYGLGVIDFTHPDVSGGSYDSPSVGHGGIGDAGEVVRLVAFPDPGVIVYLWALPDARVGADGGFSAIRPLVEDLRDAAHP